MIQCSLIRNSNVSNNSTNICQLFVAIVCVGVYVVRFSYGAHFELEYFLQQI